MSEMQHFRVGGVWFSIFTWVPLQSRISALYAGLESVLSVKSGRYEVSFHLHDKRILVVSQINTSWWTTTFPVNWASRVRSRTLLIELSTRVLNRQDPNVEALNCQRAWAEGVGVTVRAYVISGGLVENAKDPNAYSPSLPLIAWQVLAYSMNSFVWYQFITQTGTEVRRGVLDRLWIGHEYIHL